MTTISKKSTSNNYSHQILNTIHKLTNQKPASQHRKLAWNLFPYHEFTTCRNTLHIIVIILWLTKEIFIEFLVTHSLPTAIRFSLDISTFSLGILFAIICNFEVICMQIAKKNTFPLQLLSFSRLSPALQCNKFHPVIWRRNHEKKENRIDSDHFSWFSDIHLIFGWIIHRKV